MIRPFLYADYNHFIAIGLSWDDPDFSAFTIMFQMVRTGCYQMLIVPADVILSVLYQFQSAPVLP
jgi:hypothetical protein